MKDDIYAVFPGTAVSAAVGISAFFIQDTYFFSRTLPLSPLIIAIVIGFTAANLFRLPARWRPGIKFSAKRILRIAIIFMGFKLSLSEIRSVGTDALVTISAASITTLLFTVWLGRRMGIPLKRSLLLGSGVSICGASAVAAVDGVIRSKEEDAAFAIGAVTLLGTVFMFTYPLIYRITGMHDAAYALWSGSSIHEVAQVAGAGSVMNSPVSEALASSVKMIRVLFVIPLTFVLMFIPFRDGEGSPEDKNRTRKKITVPWFALLFFVSVIVNSSGFVPRGEVNAVVKIDNVLMSVAMAGLGLDISLKSLAKIGRKAFVLGVVSSFVISALSGAVILLLGSF
jgi:uncharacterized integral membrane protein (TIGR00698 family)